MIITIRTAVPDDLDLVIGFIRALAEYERLAAEVHLDRERLGAHLFGATPKAEVVIAERDGTPIGFALFFHNFSTFEGCPGVYLEDLFVFPEHRGGGHGKALLTRLAQVCVERGAPRLDWSVLDWNEPSIQFYRSLGAQPLDEWTTFRLAGDALRALSTA